MYPIKFKPILKERLWGGTKLKTLFNKPIESDITGESWEVSGVPGDISVVANGALEGKSLQELIDLYPNELLGKHVHQRFGRDFPILIKFIDAREDLSIQVHPNDKLAKERHNSFGKTEMWYVLHADADAELIVGFNKTVTKEEYQQHLDNGTLTDILNYEKVKDGDTFFINTGKVHAIGKGIIIAEIQQTSDITYRTINSNWGTVVANNDFTSFAVDCHSFIASCCATTERSYTICTELNFARVCTISNGVDAC